MGGTGLEPVTPSLSIVALALLRASDFVRVLGETGSATRVHAF